MTEPKYKIGDTIWRMSREKPTEFEIEAILTTKNGCLYALSEVSFSRVFGWKHNELLIHSSNSSYFPTHVKLLTDLDFFLSKEALIQSL